MTTARELKGKQLFAQDEDARMEQRLAEEVEDAAGTAGIARMGQRTDLSRYAAGEITGPEEIPSDEYRECLVNLLTQEADSELAGAHGYVPCIRMSPNIEEYLAVSMMVKDEFRHARVCYKLLEHLDVDVDARINSFDFTMRVNDDDLGTNAPAATAASTSSTTRSKTGSTSSPSTSAWTAAPDTSSRTS